ncbi:MAG TPA: xanthine dehydrogenase subunit D [Acidimicrobiales bacterium]|nr:xanthine dehydrogenase subunit D [Acidimicrobiales bacterium]
MPAASGAGTTGIAERVAGGRVSDRVGDSATRPDGAQKTRGEFAFSSDLWMDAMLWGKTLRSPHVAARILSIDTEPALAVPGVRAVVTAADVPGRPTFGLEVADQPVFASDTVRYHGEPIAAVAADHPEAARTAAEAIVVRYEPVDPLVDPEVALGAAPIHPDGNVFRHLVIRHGDTSATGDVVVEGDYEVGMQDQAFLGPESGLAVPSEDGGVDLYVATQWLHADRDQIAASLGLPPDRVRLYLAGVGGAFGGREDVSLQIHLCMLAMRTGRPVKMVYARDESFFGHVHRHPARMWYRHHATRDGDLVKVEARIVIDGGAYLSSSNAVISNAACFAAGPYRVPNASIEGYAVRTNNPPCGAMRGFGAVQACYGHEAQMDKLAAALSMDPVELRVRNALERYDRLVTGQLLTGAVPVREVIRAAAAHPLPPPPDPAAPMMALPGGAGATADPVHVRRGVGFAVSMKNVAYSEGFDDFSTARLRLDAGVDGEAVATVTIATAEVGQGFVTLAQQIVHEELGVSRVVLAPANTVDVGSAGSSSASRQTWMSGGALQLACATLRAELVVRAAELWECAAAQCAFDAGAVVHQPTGGRLSTLELLAPAPLETEQEYHHRPTKALDADGQGDAHVSFMFAAHRAVVDVDPELGLVRMVQVATGQDVGRALNPVQVAGQIEGGIAQGVGLAVMEEIVVSGGRVRNPSFTDYLLPTTLDMPDVVATVVEEPEPDAPYGAKGVGEPPTISSGPAVLAAIRAATGLPVTRAPVRPEDLALAWPEVDTA